MAQEFFIQRPEVKPTIYVYKLVGVKSHEGYIKVGYTDRSAEIRIEEQIGAVHVPHEILYQESAMKSDGSSFTDKQVHKILKRKGFRNLPIDKKNEWFRCDVRDVKIAIRELKYGIRLDERTETFGMRPEQHRAVMKTMEYFELAKREFPDRTPKFLWNAKMRFGKTFASYQLAKRMGFKRVLVLTFKPAVESAWSDDLLSHVDFDGWQFISNKDAHADNISMDEQFEAADKSRPIVVFGSFQDLLGTNDNGGIKAKNEFIHYTNWDLVIFDEYHFGAWRENAKKLFENLDEEESADFDAEAYKKTEADNAYNESFLPITTTHYLFLSGTPFRAINSGEFIEEQIFNWTYSDEQKAKEEWVGSGNPYAALPRMVMLTYRIPDSIRQIAMQGEFNEFDLNVFFSAKGKGKDAKFVYKNEVQKWLDLIRGSYLPGAVDDLKLGANKPPMPYNDARLLSVLTHTLWFLPNVASCFAMANLLSEKQNTFYHDYKVVVCAGTAAGIGLDALEPVQKAMDDPLATKTITLSCGKLTTGVTVKPWTGVFMLRNLKSPETYFQTAFRVQSPWEYTNSKGQKEILKEECYIFDFALDRALRQISDYSCSLDVNESNPEKKVADFIRFLPVLAYDGSKMTQISAQDVLDIALAGTSATLLARRWESALLVNVDNETLKRLMDNPDAMAALMSIEGFRSLNKDIETIINKSEAVKKAKKEKQEKLTKKEKEELSEDEKRAKSMRKQIQEKLIKFATRIPIFMYLTDYRERSLKDVITQLEPSLFKKVTGLSVKDFELLCSLNLFNPSRMNDAIFKFKRYEDTSLSYTGIDKHADEAVGGWDTVIRREEYERLYVGQQETMTSGLRTSGGTPIVAVSARENTVVITPSKPTASPSKPIVGTVTPKPVYTPTVSPKPVVEKPKEPEYIPPQIEVGAVVHHNKFGEGTITWIDGNKKYFYIKFDEKVGKTFVYPNAFKDGFLMLK
ncbi:MAG: GIY-YIG nuclease family protein [Clostridia bacterium]|nr:GIY-YIG nuclease family protein [Clostridia bacterium]